MKPHMRAVLTVVSEELIQPDIKNNPSFLQKIKDYFTGFFNKLKSAFAPPPSFEEFSKLNYKEQEDISKKLSESQGGDKTWQFIKTVFKGQSGSSGHTPPSPSSPNTSA